MTLLTSNSLFILTYKLDAPVTNYNLNKLQESFSTTTTKVNFYVVTKLLMINTLLLLFFYLIELKQEHQQRQLCFIYTFRLDASVAYDSC